MHLNPAHQSVKSCVRYLCRASARLQISSLSFALCRTVLNALFTRIAIVFGIITEGYCKMQQPSKKFPLFYQFRPHDYSIHSSRIAAILSMCSFVITSGGTILSTSLPAEITSSPFASAAFTTSPTGRP